MCPAAAGGGEQQKVAPFCELARSSWQDARSIVFKSSKKTPSLWLGATEADFLKGSKAR
jgi:hypothetical protein